VRALKRRLKESLPAAKRVALDAALRKEWLLGARRAQIVLVVVVAVGLLLFPPLRDWLAELLFSEESGRWFRRRQRLSDTGELFVSATSFLYWFAGLGAALLALLDHAPEVLERRQPLRMADPAAKAMGAPADSAPEAVPLGVQATMAADAIGPTGTLGAPVSAPAVGPTGTLGAQSSASAPAASAPNAGPTGTLGGPPASPAPGMPDAGRYVVETELGRGGMGVVFRAVDSVLERTVALKQLPRHLVGNPVLAERFRTEAKVLARLTHPGIVQVFDLVENDQGMFMAMELVHGGSLDGVLEDRGALPVAEVARLGAVMAEALAYAHAQGVVHRDFKPGNVLLADDGTPKITDFGLAKIAREGPKLTQEGAVLGSPAYMSPEQAAGGVAEEAADIYSFGVTLYEMATGRCPFEGESIASVLSAHITQPPPDPATFADIPAPLSELLLQMLAKTPESRTDLPTIATTLRSL